MGGGTSIELLSRISALEQEVSGIKQSKASPDSFGLSKASNAADVTDAGSGLVLSAVQNNAGVPGTLRNEIEKQNTLRSKDITSAETGKISNIWNSYVQRLGNIAAIHLSFLITSGLSAYEILFVIPDGFRPNREICDFAVSEGGVYTPLFIKTNGIFQFANPVDVGSNGWVHYYASYVSIN